MGEDNSPKRWSAEGVQNSVSVSFHRAMCFSSLPSKCIASCDRSGPRNLGSRLSVFCPPILWPDYAATGHSSLPA